ncbi:hypothetical protein AMK59_1804, partial [Oryctes borbonicus]
KIVTNVRSKFLSSKISTFFELLGTMTMTKTWNPCPFLNSAGVGFNYAILILNRPINLPFTKGTVVDLWQNAMVRITVDGGADRWLWWLERNNISNDIIKQPDLITGDMDSIKADTLETFRNLKDCAVVVTEDQSETDYTKALKELKKHSKLHGKQVDFVITITEDSGRFDQIIANINTLFKATSFLPNVDVYIITNEEISWLLWTGSHKIFVSSNVLQYSQWCSLIPFGSSALVTTSGLKWNLSNSALAFGQMVSTSN